MARLKYGNTRVGNYDSMKEAKRARDLELLVKAHKIAHLIHHPRYRLEVCQVHLCDYEADFQYLDLVTGKIVVEDVKGVKTPLYKLKAKLMKALYQIDVLET